MQTDWQEIRLGDYVDSCLGKMLDKEKNRGELFPYLGNKNVRWGSFDTDDLAQMRFEDHEHDRYGLKYGDLVVCEGGEPGRCAIWKEQVPEMKIQKALHRIRPHSGLNNVYLHYWFLWAGRAGLLEPYFTGTTIKHLTGRALAELQIPLPSTETQKAIAHILGSLDDKIELNRQMNTTLEAMAQALFKSWFVDFDPVIDNALAAGNPIPEALKDKAAARAALGDARKPLPEDVAGLFPEAFVWTEDMGWIPDGWEVTKAEDIATRIGMGPFGSNIKVSTFVEVGVPVINGQQLNSILLTEEKYKFITEAHAEKLNKSLVKSGDIVFTHRGTIGQVSLVPEKSKFERYIVSQSQFYLSPDEKKISSTYLIYFFRSHLVHCHHFIDG